MSTDLPDVGDKYLNSFFGGKDMGLCLQLTHKESGGYVQLTPSDCIKLIPHFQSIIQCDLGRKKQECDIAIKENEDLKKTIVNDMREVAKMGEACTILDFAALMFYQKDRE